MWATMVIDKRDNGRPSARVVRVVRVSRVVIPFTLLCVRVAENNGTNSEAPNHPLCLLPLSLPLGSRIDVWWVDGTDHLFTLFPVHRCTVPVTPIVVV